MQATYRRTALAVVHATAGLFILFAVPARAEPITIVNAYDVRRVVGPNTVGRTVGDLIELGVNIVDTATQRFTPAGTVVTATNSNAPNQTFSLSFGPDPLNPNLFDRYVPYDANLAAGTWTFSAVSNGDAAAATAGPNLAAAVPLAQNIVVAPNGLTPTVSWSVPQGFTPDRVRFRVLDDQTNVQFLNRDLPANATSYTLRPGELPGAGDFTFRIILDEFGTGGSDGFSYSHTFQNTTILPADVSLVVARPYVFRDTRTPNTAGFASGDRLTFGADFVVPNGDESPKDGFADNLGAPKPPTTGVARQFDAQGNVIAERLLSFTPVSGFPNDFSTSVPYDSVLADNAWQLTFTNGSDTKVVFTPIPGDGPQMPFAENFALTGGGTTPSFSWAIPAGANPDAVQVRIYDVEKFLSNGSAENVLLVRLPGNATSYAVPDGFLLDDHRYSVSVLLEDREQNVLVRRSRVFSDFATAGLVLPPGAPPSTPVYLPHVDPTASPSGGPVYYFAVDLAGPGTIFIDPFIAIGYDFAIGAGDPLFTSVLLPNVGDGLFDLWLFDSQGQPFDTLLDILAGQAFDFTTTLSGFAGLLGYDPAGGIDRFRILGIELAAGLDPNNATAFVTGLTFASGGRFTGSMTPIAQFVEAVPEPATLLVCVVGILGMAMAVRPRNR